MKNISTIYKKAFVFEATRFEEYSNGRCTRKESIACTIVAKPLNRETFAVALTNQVPTAINNHFGLPIFGVERGDIMQDRVMYGRIPDSFRWDDPNEPVVCEIFNSMDRIRFAMMSPLRTIEFFGEFTDIRDASQT